MNKFMRFATLVVLVCSAVLARADGPPLTIVAAENFYGNVARQIGGQYVDVVSILSNPDQDPHLFEATVSTARTLSAANIVIYNGIGYDPWMAKLLAATEAPGRVTLVVAELLHKQSGDNPHIWYDPATMPALARVLTQRLEAMAPSQRAYFQQHLQAFLRSLEPLEARIKALRGKYAGTPVTATEPVFGYMARALGLEMHNTRYQRAVMNGVEPGASTIAAFENDLKGHKVKVLFYNRQTSSGSTERLLRMARSVGIAVVGVTETEPPDSRYQDWMMSQLDALDRALAGPGR